MWTMSALFLVWGGRNRLAVIARRSCCTGSVGVATAITLVSVTTSHRKRSSNGPCCAAMPASCAHHSAPWRAEFGNPRLLVYLYFLLLSNDRWYFEIPLIPKFHGCFYLWVQTKNNHTAYQNP